MTLLLVVAASAVWVGALAWYGRRLAQGGVSPGLRAALLALRGLALLGILVLLFHPMMEREARVRRPLHLIFLLDDSTSMTLPAAEPGQDRLGQARDLLFGANGRGLVEQASRKGFESRVLALSDRRYIAGPVECSASAEETDLAGGLEWARGFAFDQDVAAVVLLSDGRQTAAGDPVRSASDTPFPVFSVGFGSTESVNDLAVIDLSAPPTVPGDEEFEVLAAVETTAPIEAGVTGRFLIDGQETAVSEATIGAGSRTVRFRANLTLKEPGAHQVGFRVDPLPNEEVTENNERVQAVIVEKAGFRVLVLAGLPGWEFKFLRRAIQESPRLEGVYVFPRSEGGTVALADEPSAPYLPEEGRAVVYAGREIDDWASLLGEVDLLVAQNLGASHLGPAWEEGLERWLDRPNRSVLFLGGPRAFGAGGYASSWVANILPVAVAGESDREQGEFSLGVATERAVAGGGSPFLQFDFDAMPPLRSLHRFSGTRAGSEVLLTAGARSGEPIPAFVVHRWGLGHVAVAGWDTLWRWQTLGREAGVLGRFWRSVLFYFLSGTDSGPVTLSLSDETFRTGEPVRARMYLSAGLLGGDLPDRVRVFLSGETVSERPVYLFPGENEPERFEGTFTIRSPGVYELRYDIGGVEGRKSIWVEAGSRERDKLSQDRELLRVLSEAAGGEYLPAEESTGLLDMVPFEPGHDVTVHRIFIGRLPWVILVLGGLFSGEWVVRRWHMLP